MANNLKRAEIMKYIHICKKKYMIRRLHIVIDIVCGFIWPQEIKVLCILWFFYENTPNQIQGSAFLVSCFFFICFLRRGLATLYFLFTELFVCSKSLNAGCPDVKVQHCHLLPVPVMCNGLRCRDSSGTRSPASFYSAALRPLLSETVII